MDALLAEKTGVEYRAVDKVDEELPLNSRIIGVEKKYVSLEFYEKYLKGKKVQDLRFIEEMRRNKDREEIRLIRKAARITEDVLREVPGDMVGKKEREVAAEAEYMIRKRAELAFSAIVAAGENSAVPHHTPGNRRIKKKDPVIIDLGARVEHYNADLTRTHVSNDGDELYEATREAQKAAIKECLAGNKIRNADQAARNVLREYGYEDLFIHSTGHGVGLDIHEMPYISKRSTTVVEDGMVFTIEPGVYFPGEFGIRIEDMVVMRGGKAEVL
jgi:Xaa-Pro dipeptidase